MITMKVHCEMQGNGIINVISLPLLTKYKRNFYSLFLADHNSWAIVKAIIIVPLRPIMDPLYEHVVSRIFSIFIHLLNVQYRIHMVTHPPMPGKNRITTVHLSGTNLQVIHVCSGSVVKLSA
jgi:hypothetical protein